MPRHAESIMGVPALSATSSSVASVNFHRREAAVLLLPRPLTIAVLREALFFQVSCYAEICFLFHLHFVLIVKKIKSAFKSDMRPGFLYKYFFLSSWFFYLLLLWRLACDLDSN